jgi:adenosylmethionine-8-amino-7-oxononanoate aminotransferase
MQPTLDDLKRWDMEHVWHPFTQMAEYAPFIIERAEGCRLFDAQGREYLDGVSSLWCNVHGHRHPRLDAALRDQIEQVAHVTLLGMSHPATIQLAKRLVDASPSGLSHVFFSGDGSSAVEVALKMAFQYWQQRSDPRPRKTKYIAFSDAYHGDTLGSVSVGGVARFHDMFGPLLFDVIRLPLPTTYRLPEGVTPQGACSYYVEVLQRTLERHQAEVAAVVIEPLMQCAAGMITHPAGFLKAVRALTRKYDVLLIADEVAVGFGRTGTLFACAQEQVSPDFLCLGKGLTAGYLALSATLTTPEVERAFRGNGDAAKTFFHGHTYAGNPLAAAVGLASLQVFEEERTLAALVPKIERLGDHLRCLATHPHVGDVRQRGLIAGIELVQDRPSRARFPIRARCGQRVCREATNSGVWLRPLGDVLVIMPPLSISLEDIDHIGHTVARAIAKVTDRDFPTAAGPPPNMNLSS